jgi:hypothetical protein
LNRCASPGDAGLPATAMPADDIANSAIIEIILSKLMEYSGPKKQQITL